ncbi:MULTISPECIES: Bax inhibitor-1/YccA family protein [Acidobacterium]|nr:MULTISPECIES: Bax inhibitor-1/YccA family protein [Acidobacterium]
MAQLMRTSNPALNERVFRGQPMAFGETMTLQGTVNKTGILLLCAMATAAFSWHVFFSAGPAAVNGLMILGLIGGLIFALVTSFKAEWSPVTAPIYALFEGLALGGISAMFELRFPGIAIESVSLTFGTMLVLLMLYKSGVIKVTRKFQMGVMAATGAIFLFYIVEMVLGFFHIGQGLMYSSSPLSIGISLVIVGIAALNLVLDFNFIEWGARSGAPKYMEWYGAFGLMVTLVWLYLEILRLMSKFQSRD